MTNLRDSTPTTTTKIDSIQKPRVMYLDIDDSIIVWTNQIMGFGAPRSADFINWSLEHFEVRWLTMWCPSGRLRQEGADELSYRLGGKISPDVFRSISNPKNFINNKTEGIDFADPRPWVWVEDGMVFDEKCILDARGMSKNFYPTNVSQNIMVLQKTWRLLAERFDLPGGPDKNYSKEMDQPKVIITINDIMDRFRNGKMQNHDANQSPELQLPAGWKW